MLQWLSLELEPCDREISLAVLQTFQEDTSELISIYLVSISILLKIFSGRFP
jgi:hypothetical protein